MAAQRNDRLKAYASKDTPMPRAPVKLSEYIVPLKEQGIHHVTAAARPGECLQRARIQQVGDSPFSVDFLASGLQTMGETGYVVLLSGGLGTDNQTVNGFDITGGVDGQVITFAVLGTLSGQAASESVVAAAAMVPGGSGAIPVDSGSTEHRYLDVAGSDSNPGTEALPWKTYAHAMSMIPLGFAGDLIIHLGAGNFRRELLTTRIDQTMANIVVIGDTSAPEFTLSGQSFAFTTNCKLQAAVPAFTSFGRTDRWMEPAVLPLIPVFGDLGYAGMVLDGSTSPTLQAIAADASVPDAGVAVHAYNTTMTTGFEMGATQTGVTIQCIGIDFGATVVQASNCFFSGCKWGGDLVSGRFINCNGSITFTDPGGTYALPYVSTTDLASFVLGGLFLSPVQVGPSSGSVPVLTTFSTAPGAGNPAVWALANARLSLSYIDFEDGEGVLASVGSFVGLSGFMDFLGEQAIRCEGRVVVSGASYTGTLSGAGITALAGGIVTGVGTKFAGVTATGNDQVAGVNTSAFGTPVVDAGVALASIV